MIDAQKAAQCLNKRVVLTCQSNVSYAGVIHDILEIHGKSGILLELDVKSGFSVWCPLDFVKSVIIVPMTDAG